MKRYVLSVLIACVCTLLKAQDSTTTTVDTAADCYNAFFASVEKIINPSAVTLILKEKHKVSLYGFLQKNVDEEVKLYGLKDLDGDGKKELIIHNFSGGAHCCDEFFFFKSAGKNTYQFTNNLHAGDVCITKDTFSYSFYEMFGYFFTCYACSLSNSDEVPAGLQPVTSVDLYYKNGKLNVRPGDEWLKKTILKNLSMLKKMKYTKVAKPGDFDDGLRKEFALNLVVYYYSYGRKIEDVKRLFDTYYRFPDAPNILKEFKSYLIDISKQNSF